jgi:nucleotide-binding universal stress UspA family protein
VAQGNDKAGKEAAEVSGKQILICYDGSDESKCAVDTAAAILGPRPAVVLNVAPAVTFAEGMVSASGVPGRVFEDLNKLDALRRAEAGAERARRAGFDAKPQATSAPSTWQGIVDVADELDASVIVLGSRGLSGLREIARGSVSHDVATRSDRPVLIVPPPATVKSAA